MLRIYQYFKNKFFAPVASAEPVKRYVLKSGQKVWECNLTTGDITEAEIIAIPTTDKRGNQAIKREVVMNPNCLYEFALNGENAVRKFESRIKEIYNNHGRTIVN